MTLPDAPAILSERVNAALDKGADVLAGGTACQDENGKGRFFAPTLVAGLDEEFELFTEESFGPIVAVSKVQSDDEAIVRMNTNKYGLTNSIYTGNRELAMNIGKHLQSGTVFMNKCDYVDPYLPWTGYKDSGKGSSCSHLGFNYVTKPKSYNFVG
jgi:acyl-CoA reductase-like NAD-dependent aldehyde dehydrogenase